MELLKSPHWETVTPEIKSLLAFMGQQDFSNRFYLAGGTALALQMGHRLSVDLDFFSEKDEVHDRTRREIIKVFENNNGQVLENVDENLLMLVQNIHVGFFLVMDINYYNPSKQLRMFLSLRHWILA